MTHGSNSSSSPGSTSDEFHRLVHARDEQTVPRLRVIATKSWLIAKLTLLLVRRVVLVSLPWSRPSPTVQTGKEHDLELKALRPEVRADLDPCDRGTVVALQTDRRDLHLFERLNDVIGCIIRWGEHLTSPNPIRPSVVSFGEVHPRGTHARYHTRCAAYEGWAIATALRSHIHVPHAEFPIEVFDAARHRQQPSRRRGSPEYSDTAPSSSVVRPRTSRPA